MKKAVLITLLLTLAGCTSLGPDIPEFPDPRLTGQLVVAYDIDTQVVVLEPGACTTIPSYDGEGEILQGVEGVGARAYYGLEPGEYCLTWGGRFADSSWIAQDNIPLTVQEGALDFVSVVPTKPEPTQ